MPPPNEQVGKLYVAFLVILRRKTLRLSGDA